MLLVKLLKFLTDGSIPRRIVSIDTSGIGPLTNQLKIKPFLALYEF
jgi:hypothetical protein